MEHLHTAEWAPKAAIQRKIDEKLAKDGWLKDKIAETVNYHQKRKKGAQGHAVFHDSGTHGAF